MRNNMPAHYICKALDAYPYDLQNTIEALEYALSYEHTNPIALSLMGRIYAEHLGNYETAKQYYQQALAADIYAVDVYPNYINVLLWNEDYTDAAKVIEFALTVKGTDKAMLYVKKALLLERQEQYNKALRILKLAKKHTYDTCFMDVIEEEQKRVQHKISKTKKKKKNKNS